MDTVTDENAGCRSVWAEVTYISNVIRSVL